MGIRIIELECPNCGGNLKRVKRDMCKCPFCNAYFLIDKQKDEVIQVPKPASSSGALRAAFVCLMLIILMILIMITAPKEKVKTESPQPAAVTSRMISSPYFIEFIDRVFSKTPETITKQELESVQMLAFEDTLNNHYLRYRLYGKEDERILIEAEIYERMKDLRFFSCLEELDVDGSQVGKEEVGKMQQLKKLACGNNPQSLAQSVYDVNNLQSLVLDFNSETMQGIAQFANLEELGIDNNDLTDISEVTMLSKLRSLSVDADALTDYAMIAELQNLRALSFEDESAKDVSFIGSMPELTSLHVIRTKTRDFSFLENNTQLKELVFDNNDEAKDYSVIGALTNLEVLGVPSASDDTVPGLQNLSKLRELTIDGSADLRVVHSLPNLEKLFLSYGSYDLSPLAGVTNLKVFGYQSLAGGIGHAEALKSLPNLEVVDISGVSLLQDMTFLFELPTMKELYIRDSKIGMYPDEIAQNDSLKILDISYSSFVTNLNVSSQGVVTFADYDKLEFADYQQMLEAFTGLEELYARGNNIDSLGFTSNYPSLKILDISDNYVKDLSPLDSLGQLEIVYCSDNPIANKPEVSYVIVDGEDLSGEWHRNAS